jgi:hypothetical protein
MKRPISFLFIFSTFIIIALAFFSRPSFALADYCSCPVSAGTCYTYPPTTQSNCEIECPNDTNGNPLCTWTSGTAPDRPSPVECQQSDPDCGPYCNNDNGSSNCCNSGVGINCSTYCGVHACLNTTQNSANCDEISCNELCNDESSISSDPCCDDSGTKRQCGDFYVGQCDGTEADCSSQICADASDAGTYCCGKTGQEILCSTFMAPVNSLVSANPAGGGGSVTANPGAATPPPPTTLTNPLGANTNNVPKLIGNIINGALGIVGSLALLMFIYGGFTWMLAAGNESAVEKGRNILTWAAIGLVVIFASYSLVTFVIGTLTGVSK